MTLSGFLLLLVKSNLAMGAAIVLVSLIRRPLRAQFGAPIAYAIWLLVPIASVASLLPPREAPALAQVAPMGALAAPLPVTGYVPHSTLDAMIQSARQRVLMPPMPMKPLGSLYELSDVPRLIFAAWLLGLLFMAAYLTRVQMRFSAAVQRGQAGPAVLGFFRPRIVTPGSFQEQFTPQEQSAILAHERAHLARQDARINTLAAFLRCFCWFNPLIHLGARWLRIDQELACDAIAVSGAISRRDYSMALLKSQVMVGVLPFGCNWSGPQHPLVKRIALLQRKPPSAARRLVGMCLVLVTATSAGLGFWAAQPPVVTNRMTAGRPDIAPPVAQGKESAKAVSSASQIAVDHLWQQVFRAGQPGANTSLPQTARRVDPTVPDVALDRREVLKNVPGQKLMPPSADLSGLPPLEIKSDLSMLTANSSPAITRSDRNTRLPLGEEHSKTEPALACLLGVAHWKCENMFVVAWSPGAPCFPSESIHYCINRITTYCAKEYLDEYCPNGALEVVNYLGTNETGADVYEVRFKHANTIYVLAPPGPDGKISRLWIKRGELNGVIPASLVRVTHQASQPATLYRRPWR